MPDSTPASENMQLVPVAAAAAEDDDDEAPRRAPEIVEDGEAFILEKLGEEQVSKIQRAVDKFNELTVDFSCSVGKVSSAPFTIDLLTI